MASHGRVAHERRALFRALRNTPHAPLAELIDWQNTPRRFAPWAFVVSIVPVLVIMGTCIIIGIAGAWMLQYLLNPGDDDAREISSGILVFGTMLTVICGLASQICTRATRSAMSELSKFPEMSLFARKAPTLYLRQFTGENQELDRDTISFIANLEKGETGAAKAWTKISRFKKDRSFENLLSRTVEAVGPLICLGDPQRRQRLGEARRIAIQSPRWQEAVHHILQHANLVVMVYTPSEALQWEAVSVLEATDKPLLLWIPHPDVPEDWKGGAYKQHLPEWIGKRMPDDSSLPPMTSRQQGLLCLLKQDRLLAAVAPQRSWNKMKRAIPVLIRTSGIRSIPRVASGGVAPRFVTVLHDWAQIAAVFGLVLGAAAGAFAGFQLALAQRWLSP